MFNLVIEQINVTVKHRPEKSEGEREREGGGGGEGEETWLIAIHLHHSYVCTYFGE